VAPHSYKGTLDHVRQAHTPLWCARTRRATARAYASLIERIAQDVVPARPMRGEARAIKRRPKNLKLMTQPQDKLRAEPELPRRSAATTAQGRPAKVA
jgi:hypothetical protein